MEPNQPSYPGGGAGDTLRKPQKRRSSTVFAETDDYDDVKEEDINDIDATVKAYNDAMDKFSASVEEYIKAKHELRLSGDADIRISENIDVRRADIILDGIPNMLNGKPLYGMQVDLSKKNIMRYNTGLFSFADAALKCGATVRQLEDACHQYSIYVWKEYCNTDVRIGGTQHMKKVYVNDADNHKRVLVRLNHPWKFVKLQVATTFGKSVEDFRLSYRCGPCFSSRVESDPDWTNCLEYFQNSDVFFDMHLVTSV